MIDVSEEVPEEDVKALLKEAGVDDNPEGWADGSRIHVNGDIFGFTRDRTSWSAIQEETQIR